jgi:hypothetical protein
MLCVHMSVMTAVCQDAGYEVKPWRKSYFCRKFVSRCKGEAKGFIFFQMQTGCSLGGEMHQVEPTTQGQGSGKS